jgi:hypothetical protein
MCWGRLSLTAQVIGLLEVASRLCDIHQYPNCSPDVHNLVCVLTCLAQADGGLSLGMPAGLASSNPNDDYAFDFRHMP